MIYLYIVFSFTSRQDKGEALVKVAGWVIYGLVATDFYFLFFFIEILGFVYTKKPETMAVEYYWNCYDGKGPGNSGIYRKHQNTDLRLIMNWWYLHIIMKMTYVLWTDVSWQDTTIYLLMIDMNKNQHAYGKLSTEKREKK